MKKLLLKLTPLMSVYHFLLSFLGALIYRFPSRKIKVIGVTGTNGKSTTVHMISTIFREAGRSVASTSSIRFEINGKERPNLMKMTMPGRFTIQRFMREAVDNGCNYLVLEVSSEGIKQHRHRFIRFHTAVITNISREHIEAHGGFENYKKAKGKLFQSTKNRHIINIDDKQKDLFLSFPAREKIKYSLRDNSAEVFAKETISDKEGTRFVCMGEKVHLALKGKFNVYNALAAISATHPEGVEMKTIKKALSKIEIIPGRMEEIISSPFRVFVDYAVTPDTLETVYKTINKDFSPEKIICVLGACGGGRDKWKRPVMGKVAAENCSDVIITNEDPYDEDPLKIIEDIARGFSQIPNPKSQISKYKKILDRRKAIRKSLELAKQGDVVIITGKGCEVWMCLKKGKKVPWDDRQVVREEFLNIQKNEKTTKERKKTHQKRKIKD